MSPTPDPRWIRGVDLFNREEFFEAHEVVEDLWNESHGPDRGFLKGFIQAAVALEHHRRGNPAGRRSVGATASGHLRGAAPDAGGLDVTGLIRDFEEFLAQAERGEDPPRPRARWLGGGPPTGEERIA